MPRSSNLGGDAGGKTRSSDSGGGATGQGPYDFLSALSSDELNALRARGRTRTYSRDESLFHEGQLPDRVYLLVSGRVKLTRVTESGKEVVLAVRGRGQLIGELSALDHGPKSASATALEPVEALLVSAADFVSFLEDSPRVAIVLLKVLGSRLRDADRKRVEFTGQDSVARVAGRIVELCESYGTSVEGGIRIDLPISQEELAGWTACSREAVSKALHQLRNFGWIETQRRSITALDIDALRRRASAI
jgi:CRP/FNR family transcriptional regulator, cyclic AMP receptor protein